MTQQPKTGDRGQRYEVLVVEDSGASVVVGWSDNEPDAHQLGLFMLHSPLYEHMRIVDRETGDATVYDRPTARQ